MKRSVMKTRKQMKEQTTRLLDIEGKIENRTIFTEEDIVSFSPKFDKTIFCGVYFLIRQDRVVYVGQSKNIFQRVSNHCGNKDFDRFSFINCPPEQLDLLESIYIHTIRPSDNGRMGIWCKGGKNTVSAPLTWEQILDMLYKLNKKPPINQTDDS